MNLSIINITNIININNGLLSVKELLKLVDYEFNNLYIDKFWNNIKDDTWIYIDNEMLLWMGFNRIESKKNKTDYTNLLKENFEIDIDYKLLNSKEFHTFSKCQSLALENIEIKTHNKIKHMIISPDCFKQSLMLLRTEKAKEIKKYYIKLEKIFKFYLEYQNQYQQLKLTNDLQQQINNNKQNNKLEKHKYLIEKFKYKRCVYIIEIVEGYLIKIGSTKNIYERIQAMYSAYNSKCILLDIFDCDSNYKEIEQNILSNKEIKQNLYKQQINGVMSKEIVQLNDKFVYEQLFHIVKENVQKHIFLNPIQLLEKQRLDMESQKINLINKLLDEGYSPNLFNEFNINIITKNESINNNIKCNCCGIKEEITNCDNKLNGIITDNKVIEEDNKNDEYKLEGEAKIPFKIKHSRGRAIQKINPNNLSVVVKVYNSMVYLLRANEGVKYIKSGVQDAIRLNKLYKGFRWCFVEKGDDPLISKAGPTNNEFYNRITEPIVKINSSKNEILDIYQSQEECFLNNGLKKEKLLHLIKTGEMCSNVYFIKITDCNQHLLEKFNIANIKFSRKTKAKPIISINPLTKEELEFKTIGEIPHKLGGTESSINIAIKNNTIYNGYYWKLKE